MSESMHYGYACRHLCTQKRITCSNLTVALGPPSHVLADSYTYFTRNFSATFVMCVLIWRDLAVGVCFNWTRLTCVCCVAVHLTRFFLLTSLGVCLFGVIFTGQSNQSNQTKSNQHQHQHQHQVPDEDLASVREMYKKKHPKAYWVDFGDFRFMRMDTIKAMRFVGGFAMAGDIDADGAMPYRWRT